MADEDNEYKLEEYDEKREKRAKIGWIVFFSILIAAIVACIVVVAVLK